VTASNSPCFIVAAAGDFPTACIAAANRLAPGPVGVPNNTGIAQLSNIGCYFYNGSALVPPAQGTYGTMPVNQLRGKGYESWDASLIKDWKIKERLTTEFRVEGFNILNRVQYASVGVNLGAPSTFGLAQSTTDVAHGNPVVGAGGPRTVQLGLKFLF